MNWRRGLKHGGTAVLLLLCLTLFLATMIVPMYAAYAVMGSPGIAVGGVVWFIVYVVIVGALPEDKS